MRVDKSEMQQKEGITVGEWWLFSNSVTIPLKLGSLPRRLSHNITWPMTDLTHTDSLIHIDSGIPTSTDLAHKHIRPHKHIGPHRNIGQDQLTNFCNLHISFLSTDIYLSVGSWENVSKKKSPVSSKFSTDICLLSWTTVSQRNPRWVGNASGYPRP